MIKRLYNEDESILDKVCAVADEYLDDVEVEDFDVDFSEPDDPEDFAEDEDQDYLRDDDSAEPYTEDFIIARNRKRLNEASRKDLGKEYFANEENPTMEGLCDYIEANGGTVPDHWRDPNKEDKNFAWASREFGGGDFHQSSAPAEPEVIEPASDKLRALQALCVEGEQLAMDAASTVARKYAKIESKMKRVMRGKTLKRYYLLYGDPGIGKSHTVFSCLDELGLRDTAVYVRGDMGKDRTAVAGFLCKYRNEKLIILDDCDTMIRADAPTAVQNMLKGALDPDPKANHTVTIADSIRARVRKYLAEDTGLEAKRCRIDRYGKLHFLNESEDDSLDLDGDEYAGEDMSDDDGYLETEEVPSTFSFNPRMILLSNIVEKADVASAVMDRMESYCLRLTRAEYLVKVAKVFKECYIEQNETGWNDDQVANAREVAYETLLCLIEAADKKQTLFGKKVEINTGLTFRLCSSMIEAWIVRLEEYYDENPDSDYQRAYNYCMPLYVKEDCMPLIHEEKPVNARRR